MFIYTNRKHLHKQDSHVMEEGKRRSARMVRGMVRFQDEESLNNLALSSPERNQPGNMLEV